tara:strand:+ start:189 stop:1373 length:1185 start_codon:yes stop_codon:yes gene_type:complete
MTDINKELEAIADEVFVDEDEQLVEEPVAANAPKRNASPAEPMQKIAADTPGGEVEDMGPAVVSPDAPSDPGKVAAKKAKKTAPPKTDASDASPKPMGDGSGPMKSKNESIGDEDEDEAIVAESTGDDEEETEISIDERIAAMDFSDDVKALTEGGDDDDEEVSSSLSQEFKQKAATIFEAAVKSKIRAEMERIEEEYETAYREAFNEAKDEMAEKVDGYLAYVVEEWMKQNEMAVEHKMKTEIAESFITGLKTLFDQHNIAIPDEQFDMLDAAAQNVNELESRLNETLEKNVELTQEVSQLKKQEILFDVASDLADTEVEKFAGLVENIDYESEKDFREKVETIKESYFPKVQSSTNDDTAAPIETEIDVDMSDNMAAYMNAIRRTNPVAKAS